jgi:hypothetical protein
MKNVIRLLVCGVVALALVAGPGIAQASAAGHAAKARKAAKARHAAKRLQVNAFILRQSAKALDLKGKALAKELKGTTLAAVITAHGKNVAEVQAAIVAAFTAKLDARVKAQKLTQTKADAQLNRFQQHLAKFLNHEFKGKPKAGAAAGRAARIAVGAVLRKAAADYLGLSRAELRQQLAGHSLAQLAEAQSAQGKSVQGLEDAMVAAVTAKLNAAVTNGRLSQTRADKVLAKVQAHIDAIVNKVHSA